MLSKINLTQELSAEAYAERLPQLQSQLRALTRELYDQRRSLVIVIEGWEASDKGGIIQRITAELDPRGYEVFRILPANGEERQRNYLWRFWQLLRPAEEKQVLIFDRSWYGRVLRERIEGHCTEDAWKRAYREINEFESQLLDYGILIAKFFTHLDREVQLERLEQRRNQADALWRLTPEDWAEHAQWEAYAGAVEDMLLRTSTAGAPWTIIPSNNRRLARIRVLEELTRLLSRELEYQPLKEAPAVTSLEAVQQSTFKKGGKKSRQSKDQSEPREHKKNRKKKKGKGKKGKKDPK